MMKWLLLIFGLMLLIGTSSAVPVFYDDFGDGKWTDRTGNNPYGQPYINWSVNLGSASDFEILDGRLYANHTTGERRLQMDLSPEVTQWFNFSFDYITNVPDTTQDYFSVSMYNETGWQWELKRKNDGHLWYSLIYPNGTEYVGLVAYGSDGAPASPVASGVHQSINVSTLYHLEIRRFSNHAIELWQYDNKTQPTLNLFPGVWSDLNYNRVGLSYEDTTACNIEFWDNPRLYTASPLVGGQDDGSLYDDVTLEANITNITIYWSHFSPSQKAFALDNISITQIGGWNPDPTKRYFSRKVRYYTDGTFEHVDTPIQTDTEITIPIPVIT